MMEDNGQKSSQDFWSSVEIKNMLDYISGNYKKWCKNKNKLYEELVNEKILADRDINQIKNKMNKLRSKYFDEKGSVTKQELVHLHGNGITNLMNFMVIKKMLIHHTFLIVQPLTKKLKRILMMKFWFVM